MLSYIITYGSMLLFYFLFFIAVSTGAKSGSGKLKNVLAGKADAGVLFTQLVSGLIFLGIGSIVLFEKRNIDTAIISFDFRFDHFVWILTATAVQGGILSAFKNINPNNSIHSLSAYLPLSFILVRTLFLIVYEIFFRGAMLFIMIEDMNIVLAIIFNLFFYMMVHWFHKQERYGSLIMGIVLCSVTIYYHSVWPAILIHLSLALSYEISLLIKYKSLFKKSLI
jgi:membrane protease YdiL (CAAX protease family)